MTINNITAKKPERPQPGPAAGVLYDSEWQSLAEFASADAASLFDGMAGIAASRQCLHDSDETSFPYRSNSLRFGEEEPGES
jgi:hypothetical protein